jgi:hypothetical protein
MKQDRQCTSSVTLCCFSVTIDAVEKAILSHKRHVLRKGDYKIFIFSTNCVQNISHSKENLERYYHKCIYVFM